jgi:hypothetical protein
MTCYVVTSVSEEYTGLGFIVNVISLKMVAVGSFVTTGQYHVVTQWTTKMNVNIECGWAEGNSRRLFSRQSCDMSSASQQPGEPVLGHVLFGNVT